MCLLKPITLKQLYCKLQTVMGLECPVMLYFTMDNSNHMSVNSRT